MKKKHLKNLKLNRKLISSLTASQSLGGNNSVIVCIRTFVDANGNNICLRTVFNCDRTRVVNGCVKTNEVDTNTYAIC